MSQGTLSCAEHLSQLTRKRGLTWLSLLNHEDIVSGMMNVRSLNSLVTDSAASASAWGSGSRVVNGAVNVLPDGRELKPLFELFGSVGWKRGLVTTTELTHATPAGFIANVTKRSDAAAIAVQMFERRVDVLLGGGGLYFSPKGRNDQRDLHSEFVRAGYHVMKNGRDLDNAPTDKEWFGTFAPSHLPFTLDRMTDGNDAGIPTLAEMARAALRKLEREEHFILQVEGGRVDQAAHLNDAAGTFREMIAFDEALEVCLAFKEKHPETLLVVTTDHGTGNPGLNGTGKKYDRSTGLFENLTRMKHTHEWMLRRIYGLPAADYQDLLEDDVAYESLVSPKVLREIVETATELEMNDRQAAELHDFFAGMGNALYDMANNGEFQLAQFVASRVGVSWTSLAHTSDFVPILAMGPGAERFGGFIQNTDVFRNYTQLARIDFQNPSMRLMA